LSEEIRDIDPYRPLAYDEDNGKVLWEHELPMGSDGIPAVYEVGGKEYIAFCVAGRGRPQSRRTAWHPDWSTPERIRRLRFAEEVGKRSLSRIASRTVPGSSPWLRQAPLVRTS